MIHFYIHWLDILERKQNIKKYSIKNSPVKRIEIRFIYLGKLNYVKTGFMCPVQKIGNILQKF